MHFFKLFIFFTPYLFYYMHDEYDMAITGSQLKVIDAGNTFNFWNLFRAKRILLELIIVVKTDMQTQNLSTKYCSATCSYSEFTDLSIPHYEHMNGRYKLVKTELSIADDPFDMSFAVNKSVSILYSNVEVKIFEFKLKSLLENSKLVFFEKDGWQGEKARRLLAIYNNYTEGLPLNDIEDNADSYDEEDNQYRSIAHKNKNYRFNPPAY